MNTIKNVLVAALVSLLAISYAQADSAIYLLRHAEKQKDGTNDPHLTNKGHKRSELLAQQLSTANISKIYSTNYQRTRETVKPLSDSLGIAIQSYDPEKLEEFAEVLKAESGSIVVVGHSNTTPNLTSLLSGSPVDSIDDNEYDNLYQVVYIGGKAQLNRFRIFPID